MAAAEQADALDKQTMAAAEQADALGRQLMAAASAGDLGGLRAALAAGAPLDWADAAQQGMTPLMCAAEEGHLQAVQALLEAGCPWNAQDGAGYCAGEYAGKHPAIAELLLEWGVQAELLLAAADRDATSQASSSPAPNAGYLSQRLHYSQDGSKLLDADGEAVMMGWEAPLMQRHAGAVCGAGGGRYLNVGFGLGIIDEFIQSYAPASHTIIEAHPDVHAHMLARGWDKRPGVRLLFGRWQDVLHQVEPGSLDGAFFDTYGEYYEELRAFNQALPRLLAPAGVYSYFNGLASDNLFFHAVYGRLVQVELASLGLATRFEQLPVAHLGDDVWQGVRNKYWRWPHYFLPIVTRAPAAAAAPPGEAVEAGAASAAGEPWQAPCEAAAG